MTQLGLIEVDTSLANYEYTGAWIDAAGAGTIRVGYRLTGSGISSPGVKVQQSNDQTNLVGAVTEVGTTEYGQMDVPVAARYFRLYVTCSGDPDPAFRAAIRGVD